MKPYAQVRGPDVENRLKPLDFHSFDLAEQKRLRQVMGKMGNAVVEDDPELVVFE